LVAEPTLHFVVGGCSNLGNSFHFVEAALFITSGNLVAAVTVHVTYKESVALTNPINLILDSHASTITRRRQH